MRACFLVLVGCGGAMRVAAPAYLHDIPLAQRSLAGAMVATPAARPDARGVGYAGANSAQNRYTLDGADITSPRTGMLGHDVPLDFLEELSLVTGGATPNTPTALGGVVTGTTRSGSNEWHGSAFGWLDRTRDGEVGATVSGPIVRDRAWFFAGLAPTFGDTREVPALLRVDIAIKPQHQVQLTTFVTGDDADVIGHERSHFNDEKTQVDTMIAWHREALDSRASGHVELVQRMRAVGWHEFTLGVTGERTADTPLAAHALDGAGYARDLWQLKSNLTVDAGVRFEDERLGGIDVAPRLGIVYDPTREGLAKVFAHWGRYFDELPVAFTLPVDPRTRPGYVDELLAGMQAEVADNLLGMTFQQRVQGREIGNVVTAAGDLAFANIPAAHTYDALEFSLSRRISRVLVSAAYTYAYLADGIVPAQHVHDAKLDAIYAFGLARTLTGTIAARASSTGLDAHLAIQRHFKKTSGELFIEAFDVTEHTHNTPNARLGARLAF